MEYGTGVGDVDGDGLDDIAIAVPQNDDGGLDAGKTYLIYGSSLSSFSSLSLPLSLSDLAKSLNESGKDNEENEDNEEP